MAKNVKPAKPAKKAQPARKAVSKTVAKAPAKKSSEAVKRGVKTGIGEQAPAGFSWEPLTVEPLPNGLTVVIKEDHTVPLAVTDAWFRVGSRNEDDRTNGIAHFLEHTLFKGTKTRGVGQIARDIEAFGGRTNAGTSNDYTHYYISCESRHIDKALEIHADVFRNSTLSAENIDRERSVIIEEIKRADDNPAHVLWHSLLEGAYRKLPYRRTTLGPRENIATGITREDMAEFFRAWYGPANMTLLVVGAVDTAAVLAKVKSLYGDWRGPKPPAARFGREPAPTEPVCIRRELEVTRSYLMMAWRTVPVAEARTTVALDLLGVVLGQGRTSRLSQALKENRGIVTSIVAGQQALIDDGLFLVRAEFDPADEEEVRRGIRAELRRMIDEPVTADELQKAREYLENGYLRGIESVEGKAESLGSSIVKADLAFETSYLARLREVTPADLHRLAREFLDVAGYVDVVVGPKPAYQEISSSTSAAAGKSTAEAGGAVTKLYRLANGMRIIHRQLPGTGLVGVSLAVDAGSIREPAGQAGISNLTAEMMLKGTRRRDGQKLLWELESLGAELGAMNEPDLVRFNLGVSRTAFGRAFELLADVIRRPVFPAEAFAVERGKVLMRLRAVADDMSDNTWRLFHATLFKGHPYGVFSLGEAAQVEALQVEHLKAFHAARYTPDRMVMAVVGDLSAEELLRQVGIRFGTMAPAGGGAAGDAALPKPVAPTWAERVVDTKKKAQAMVFLGWLGPEIGHPDYPALKVLNAVLGGGMSARYFMKIRNQAGLAYALSSAFPSRIHGAPFFALIGTDPGAVDRVREMVQAEIAEIAANGPSPEELDRALSYASGQFALDHGTCLRAAHYLAWFESIGAGFAYDEAYPAELWKVTADDVKRVAATWLKPDRAVMAITGPLEK